MEDDDYILIDEPIMFEPLSYRKIKVRFEFIGRLSPDLKSDIEYNESLYSSTHSDAHYTDVSQLAQWRKENKNT